MRGVSLTFDGLNVRGFSRAGDETWFRVDPPGLALDVGRGASPLIGTRWIFLSHSHLDHAVGIPWVLTQRKLQGLGTATVFCPRVAAGEIREYITVGGRLEGVELEAEVIGLEAGESRELGRGLRLEAFAATHTIPALGCHLVRRRSKLRSEFEGMSPIEVADLKRKGVEIVRDVEELWLSYCGDSSAAVFVTEPRLFDAKILLVECTFLGPETRDHGERFGHMHLQDLAAVADRFENEAIVLHHLSRRHRLADLEEAVVRELPNLAPRIYFITGDASLGGE
jgi:ribonuclease Z